MVTFIKKYWKHIIVLLMLMTIVVLVNRTNNQRKTINDLKADTTRLSTQIDTFRNKTGLLIAEQQVAEYENKQRLKELSNTIFDLEKKNQRLVKQVNYYGQVGQITKIDSVFIPYVDTVLIDTGIATNMISVPKKFSTKDKYYTIEGIVKKEGVSVDNIEIINTVSFREIEKKQGLFKAPITTLQVINSNEFVTTTGITSVNVKHKPSAWNRWIKPTLVGLGVGFVTYKIVK